VLSSYICSFLLYPRRRGLVACCCTEKAKNETSGEDDEKDDDTGVTEGQYVTLMVVMPIFLLCYGGSCVAYVAYKIYRNFSRRALHAKFVELHAADYASQMMPPSYPVMADGFLAKKEPCQPSAYVSAPCGAAAAVSFLHLHVHKLHVTSIMVADTGR